MSPFSRDELKPKVSRRAMQKIHQYILKSPLKYQKADDEILSATSVTLEPRSRSFFDRPGTGISSTHVPKPRNVNKAGSRNKSAYNLTYHDHPPETFIKTGVKQVKPMEP